MIRYQMKIIQVWSSIIHEKGPYYILLFAMIEKQATSKLLSYLESTPQTLNQLHYNEQHVTPNHLDRFLS